MLETYMILLTNVIPINLIKTFLIKKRLVLPWLVWFSGFSASLWTIGSLVRFPVRGHAWVAGQVPRGHVRGNPTVMFLSLSFFLPSPLSKSKSIKSFFKTAGSLTNSIKMYIIFYPDWLGEKDTYNQYYKQLYMQIDNLDRIDKLLKR